MKRTTLKELFKTIGSSKVTFCSILLFVLMGMALFCGIDWTAKCSVLSMTNCFEIANSHDIELNFATGYKNPDDFLNIENIDESEGIYSYTTEFKDGNYGFEAKFMSLPKQINTPYDIEGKLPDSKGEIALIKYWAEDNGYKIGDKITIKNEPVFLGEARFTTDTFEVTALINSSLFTASKTLIFGINPTNYIPVNASFYVAESSFSPILNEQIGYNVVYLRSDSLREYDYFDENYSNSIREIKKKITSSSFLEDKTYSLSLINDSITYQNINLIDRILGKIKYSMAGLFIIIGFLVSYFAISRTINENKVLIGVKKAKGFKNSEIYFFYLTYVAIAVIIGGIIGAFGARFITEPIIVNAILTSVVLPKMIFATNILEAILFILGELVLQLLITLICSKKALKKRAIDLIKNENPVYGKKRFYQKGRLWNKLSLFSKTLINNLVNDKTRVFSMLVGIAGVASLIVCALTINSNITKSLQTQLENIYNFQAIIYLDTNVDNSNLKSKLDSKNYKYDEILMTFFTVDAPSEQKINHQVYVFESDKFNEFINMTTTNGKHMDLEDGVYVSCSFQEEYKISPDSTISIKNSKLKSFAVPAKGYFRHHLINNVMFMNSKTYEEDFEETYIPNAIIVNLEDKTFDDLNDLIHNDEAVIYSSDTYTVGVNSFEAITSIFKIVDLVYLILSVIMALLVILDLLSMFIAEKKNELITLIINGYSRKKAKKYIYFDTIILSIIGIGLGVLLGTLMSNLSVNAFKCESMYFITGFDLFSCLIGVAGASVIILGVTLLAIKKIDKFKLSDINKLS